MTTLELVAVAVVPDIKLYDDVVKKMPGILQGLGLTPDGKNPLESAVPELASTDWIYLMPETRQDQHPTSRVWPQLTYRSGSNGTGTGLLELSILLIGNSDVVFDALVKKIQDEFGQSTGLDLGLTAHMGGPMVSFNPGDPERYLATKA